MTCQLQFSSMKFFFGTEGHIYFRLQFNIMYICLVSRSGGGGGKGRGRKDGGRNWMRFKLRRVTPRRFPPPPSSPSKHFIVYKTFVLSASDIHNRILLPRLYSTRFGAKNWGIREQLWNAIFKITTTFNKVLAKKNRSRE